MHYRTLLLILACCGFSICCHAQAIASYELTDSYHKARLGQNNLEERRSVAMKLRKAGYIRHDGDLEQYLYIANLLKDSQEPADVMQAVAAMDTFLRNTKDRYGYHFTSSYHREEVDLALLLISRYYYFVQTGQLQIDARYTLAEAVDWFEDALDTGNPFNWPMQDLQEIKDRIIAQQEQFKPQGNAQALAATQDVIRRYSGIFLCRLGGILKDRGEKKEAKSCFKKAIDYGNADAKEQLNNINVAKTSPYGVFDYRLPNYKGGTISKADLQTFGGGTRQAKSYDEWWEKTYGKGGSQSAVVTGTGSSANSTSQENARHQRAMDQIYRDTEKQMNKSFESRARQTP